MNENLEVATAGEEVATAGEAVVEVDLSTVSQQLDQMMAWQALQFVMLVILSGLILGVAVGKAIERMWH